MYLLITNQGEHDVFIFIVDSTSPHQYYSGSVPHKLTSTGFCFSATAAASASSSFFTEGEIRRTVTKKTRVFTMSLHRKDIHLKNNNTEQATDWPCEWPHHSPHYFYHGPHRTLLPDGVLRRLDLGSRLLVYPGQRGRPGSRRPLGGRLAGSSGMALRHLRSAAP